MARRGAPGDAIGDSARRVRDLLRGLGHESELFALTIDEDLEGEVRPFSDPAARRGDVTILHYALPSPMTAALASLDRGRVLHYHNVTPAAYFAPYDAGPVPAGGARPPRSSRRWSDTSTSRSASPNSTGASSTRWASLRTGVLPIAVDTARITAAGPPAGDRAAAGRRARQLSVRRPDRAEQEDRGPHLLAEHYKRYVDAYYRFIFVGRYDAVPRYYAMIRALISEFKMLEERFIFTGPVSDEELAVYYRHAAVYISMSEHEGFCAPLSRRWRRTSRSWPMRPPRSPRRLAAPACSLRRRISSTPPNCSAALAFDDDLRTEVIAGQRRRLQDFGDARIVRDLAARDRPLS